MKTALLSNLVSELFDNFESELLFNLAQNMFFLIFISVILFLIVFTPVVLFYSAIDNYFKWKTNQHLIDDEICCSKNKSHPDYVSKVCLEHRKTSKRFLANTFGLIAWNVASLVYIFANFTSFNEGLVTYFSFPFKAIQAYDFNNVGSIFDTYSSNLIYMILILAATFVVFQLGKFTSPLFIRVRKLNFSRKLSVI
jgi:hypothetical protein